MRIFKTPIFAKWAKTEKLSDKNLIKSVKEIEQGLIDANLGGHIYKKRIALPGRGKRNGARTILAYQIKKTIFFIFGFAKNEKDTISDEELEIAKIFAAEILKYTNGQLDKLIKDTKLYEVKYEE